MVVMLFLSSRLRTYINRNILIKFSTPSVHYFVIDSNGEIIGRRMHIILGSSDCFDASGTRCLINI